MTIGLLERINQKPRSSALAAGEKIVLYVPAPRTPGSPAEIVPAEDRSDVAVAASTPAGDDPTQGDEVKPATLPPEGEAQPAKKPSSL
jgi:hypothetical protein